MLSRPLIKYVLTAALRDKLMIVSLLVVIIGAALSIFLGSSAIVEPDRFATVFTASALRFAGMAGLVLFIIFYMRRAFETREVEFLLSRPISRTAFLLSHAAAFSLLAFLIAGLVVIAVFATAPHQSANGLALWGFSLFAEFMIMANAALFFAMVLPSATGGAMAVFGLYILARLMGELLGIIYTGTSFPGHEIVNFVMQVVSLIVPRLDLLGQSSWLIYGTVGSAVGAGFIVAQGLIYSALLVAAALVDLVRRQF